jgi:molybdate transport system permease protein
VETSLAATFAALVLGIPAALWSARRRSPLVRAFDSLVFFPVIVSPTVLGLVLVLIFGGGSAVGAGLESLGCRILFSWPATVVVGTLVAFPLVYLATKRAVQRIDESLLETMRVFGFSGGRLVSAVVLPLIWPAVLAGAVLGFVRVFGEFGATLMLAGDIPGKTRTVPLAIYSHVQTGDLSGALVLSGLFIVIALAALYATSRLPSGN